MDNALDAEQTSIDTPLFKAMTAFFTDDGWPFIQLEGRPMLTINFEGKNARWACFAQAREEQSQFVFYSLCPVNAPADRRAAMAEFLSRANYGLIVGNFEMDFEDGEIRYKTSVDFEGLPLAPAAFRTAVYANVSMMDQYFPGLMSILHSTVSPREMIDRIEG